MIATALKICTKVLHLLVPLKKIIKSIVGRYIPNASKNKPLCNSYVEAVIFYFCSPDFIYYPCHTLYCSKKKATMVLRALEEWNIP